MAGRTIRPSTPIRWASAANLPARAVVHSATPLSTGMRPATWSTVARKHLELLRILERAVLADGPEHDQAVDARVDHPVDVARASPARFSDWSAWNWVVAAGKTPSHDTLMMIQPLEGSAQRLTPPRPDPNEDKRSPGGREVIDARSGDPDRAARSTTATPDHVPDHVEDDLVGVAPAILAEELDRRQRDRR